MYASILISTISCSAKLRDVFGVELDGEIHLFVELMTVSTGVRAGLKSSIHTSLGFCTVYAQGNMFMLMHMFMLPFSSQPSFDELNEEVYLEYSRMEKFTSLLNR